MPEPGQRRRPPANAAPAVETGNGASEPFKLAVNLFDLDRVEPAIRRGLLAGKLIPEAIRVDPARPDEAAVAFSCSTLDAACVCDVIRNHDRRAGDFPTRVYVKRQAWSKLPSHAVLTLVIKGRCVLNPQWFPVTLTSVVAPVPLVGRRLV